MKLTRAGIKDRAAWEKAGITLPGYDVEAVYGFILASETFSVYLLAELRTDFWKRASWTGESPVWRHLTMMWWIKSISRMTIWD